MPVNFAGRPHNRNLLPDETLCTYTTFGSSFRSMCRLSNACSRLSDSGKGTKEWEIEDEPVNGARRPSSLQFPPLFGFALSQFPRVYSLRPLHFHSILNNRKKRKSERLKRKSSSTVGVFVILDNVSSLPSFMHGHLKSDV